MNDPHAGPRDDDTRRDAPDLAAFARVAPTARRPRRIWTRVLVATILLGFLGLLIERSRDAWFPAREVTIVRPIASQRHATPAGTVVAEAAGFVEPEPDPFVVTSRVDGVYEEVFHRSGDAVEVGARLARVDAVDLEAEHEAAASARLAAETIVEAALRAREIAQSDHDLAIDLEAARRAAVANEIAAAEEARHREASIRGAEAALEIAKLEYERESLLATQGVAGPKQLEIASARRVEAEALLETARADAARARAAARTATIEKERAERALETRFETGARLAAAESTLAEARADLATAVEREQRAARDVERCVLFAPITGVIARVNVAPGGRADTHSPAFVLFDPNNLRCRVDVPLSRVADVSIGQDARVTLEGTRLALRGTVIRIGGEADVAKVSLRVHVKIMEISPDSVPERICRVEFLGRGGGDPGVTRGVAIPKAAIREGGYVLVLDAEGRRAVKKKVETTTDPADPETIVVDSGLDPSDKVIVDSDVREGDRVKPIGGSR